MTKNELYVMALIANIRMVGNLEGEAGALCLKVAQMLLTGFASIPEDCL